MYACIITPDAATVISQVTGESYTVYANEPGFESALDAIRNNDFEEFIVIATPAEMFKQEFCGGRVALEDGVVYLDGRGMHGTLSDRMIDMVRDGFDVEPLAKFMVNLDANPSKRAVDELYGFLEASNLAITPDGYFVAYKKVRDSYMDVHSGTFDNSPGAVCEMPRNMVDEDKARTCSAGLHFCGREYLSEYPGARTMIVKINPADVVAIPEDYNNHKGRTCKYEVIGELTGDGRDGWGGRDDERPEEKLEGAVFTGEGYNTVDDAFGDTDLDTIRRPTSTVPDNLHKYHGSRQDARRATWADSSLKVKDLGQNAPTGYRWATVYK